MFFFFPFKQSRCVHRRWRCGPSLARSALSPPPASRGLRASLGARLRREDHGKYCETPDAPSPPCFLRTSRPPVLRWSVALIQRAAMRTLQGRVRMAPRWRYLAFCREILALRAPNSRQNAPPSCRLVLVLWSRQARTASGNSGAWLHGSAYGLRFTSALAPPL